MGITGVIVSDNNVSKITGDELERIYNKLWSVKSLLNILQCGFAEDIRGDLVQVCFVLYDLMIDIEELLPEM